MSDDWKAGLPAELAEKPMIANAKSLDEVLNNAVGLESKLGRMMSIPNDEWSDAERGAWRDKVKSHDPTLSTIDDKVDILKKWGLPDDATGYQIDPDREYGLSPEQIDEIKGNAFSTAMTQEQFYHSLHTADDRVSALTRDNQAAIEADRQTVFDEWGADKARQLDNIEAYMDLMGADEGMKKAVRENMSSDQLRFFAKATESVKGESIQGAKDRSQGKGTMTPAEANTAMQAVLKDPDFRNKMSPNHVHLQNRYLRLVNMAAGRPPEAGLS